MTCTCIACGRRIGLDEYRVEVKWGMATILSEMGHCLHDTFTIAHRPMQLVTL